MVSSALLGMDTEAIFLGSKVYVAHPPTIKALLGAAPFLKEVEQAKTTKDMLYSMNEDLAKALSWLIHGNGQEYEEFLECNVNDVVKGLNVCLGMIDPSNFSRLSAFARNVRSLIAKPR